MDEKNLEKQIKKMKQIVSRTDIAKMEKRKRMVRTFKRRTFW